MKEKLIRISYPVAPMIYLEYLTNKTVFSHHWEKPAEYIDRVLQENELYEYVGGAALDDIEHFLKENQPCVLVDCSYYIGETYMTNIRWYPVPKDFCLQDYLKEENNE